MSTRAQPDLLECNAIECNQTIQLEKIRDGLQLSTGCVWQISWQSKLDEVRKWMRLVDQMQSEFGCSQKLEVKAEEDDGK